MRTQKHFRGHAITALVGLAIATPALAQWPTYIVEQIGLQGPEYVGPLGQRTDTFERILPEAIAVGQTSRLAPGVSGMDAWVWSEADGTRQIGLIGPEYTSANGRQVAEIEFANAQGMVAGTSHRPINPAGDYGLDVWLWDGTSTIQLGFTGPGYTFDIGSRMSFLFDLTASGIAAGTSLTTSADLFGYGRDAWIWRNGAQHQVGLTGPDYTLPTGYRLSVLQYLNESGQLVGYTERRNDIGWRLGQDVWVADGPTTHQIGLIGGDYIDSDGYQFSSATKQYESGHVLGYSKRFDDQDEDAGQDAWIYDGTTTRALGLTGVDYTSISGYQSSSASGVTPDGSVVGTSTIYIDQSTEYGSDAWYWNGTSTQRIGLQGPEYTGTFGYRSSSANLVTDGRIVGTTLRVIDTSTNNGRDVWIFDGATTHQTGLVGAGYESSTGFRTSRRFTSTVRFPIAGYSDRYTPTKVLNGQDVWVWNGTSSVMVSLSGPEHTGSDGYRQSDVVTLSPDFGQLRGTTKRITGVNTENGQDVWWWDGTTTRQLGLTGPDYVSPTGFANTTITAQNAADQAAGQTWRFNPDGSSAGRVAWYFDPATGVTSAIIASLGPNGTATSSANLLTEDGFLLGTYYSFPNGTTPLHRRGFIFRPDRGFADLGELTDGALSDWSQISVIDGAISDQLIFGRGLTTGQINGLTAFVLRAVGEPDCPICPADYDNDGGVTGADLGAFFADFEAGNPCADVDQDGGITGADLATFFASYELGGC